MKEYLDDEQALSFKILGRVFSMTRFCHDKKLTQQRQNSFRKTQNFYRGVSEN